MTIGKLAPWYRDHGRHALPWRASRDRWTVLVSEVMLHQTQVPRVASVFDVREDAGTQQSGSAPTSTTAGNFFTVESGMGATSLTTANLWNVWNRKMKPAFIDGEAKNPAGHAWAASARRGFKSSVFSKSCAE